MKKIAGILILSVLFTVTACGKRGGEVIKIEESQKEKNWIKTNVSPERVDLEKLLSEFSPEEDTSPFIPESDGQGLPLALVNEMKRALYDTDDGGYVFDRGDESLMIGKNDFVFIEGTGEKVRYAENDLNELMLRAEEAADSSPYQAVLFYQCDVDGDGEDEIVVIQNEDDDNENKNSKVFILEKEGEGYAYSQDLYMSHFHQAALFEHEGKFYIIASYIDEGRSQKPEAFRLFGLEEGGGIYVRTAPIAYEYHRLYQNPSHPLSEAVREYAEEISTDVIYADRQEKTFYGDETEEEAELLEKVREKNEKLNISKLYSIDVDNDGTEECFDRKMMYHVYDYADYERYQKQSMVRWYDTRNFFRCDTPFSELESSQYLLAQRWFKVIEDKTVIFSLYHKADEELSVLDARIFDGHKTEILLDAVITIKKEVETANSPYYEESNKIQTEYANPDFEKAFPENMYLLSKEYAQEVEGKFTAVDYADETIPNELIVMMEKALFEGDFEEVLSRDAFLEADREAYLEKYWGELHDEYYEEYLLRHVYHYELEGEKYYLTVEHSGGTAGFVGIYVYREIEDGRDLELVEGWNGLDTEAKVIQYQNELYLIERSYNYYSKVWDTVYLYKLVPEKIKQYVYIRLYPEEYFINKIYDKEMPYSREIEEYVESIWEELMEKSPISDDIELFTGVESSEIDKEKLQRIQSVEGSRDSNADYMEVDFNNDGEPEYIRRAFWFPSNSTLLYLQHWICCFADGRVVEKSSPFSKGGDRLIQLWFQEIDGKVFTFRLFLNDGYNYCLNVSLMEGDCITQVQTYLIIPRREFQIESPKKDYF